MSKKIVSIVLIIISAVLISCGHNEEEGKVHGETNYYEKSDLTPRLLQDLAEEGAIAQGDRVKVFGFLQTENSVGYLYEYKDLSELKDSPFRFNLLLQSYANSGVALKACDGKYSSVYGKASYTLGIYSIKNIVGIRCSESNK